LTEPASVAFGLLYLDDTDKAKVWAGFLAPGLSSYEWPSNSNDKFFLGSLGTTGANREPIKAPAPIPNILPSIGIPNDLAMRQAQRLLSTIKNPDLDLLDFRIILLSNGLEALLICDQSTDTSYAAFDVESVVPGLRMDWSLVPSNSEKYPRFEDHLDEYLSKCSGNRRFSLQPDDPTCVIEVPESTIGSPKPDDLESHSTNNFQGALDRFVDTFISADFRSTTDFRYFFWRLLLAQEDETFGL